MSEQVIPAGLYHPPCPLGVQRPWGSGAMRKGLVFKIHLFIYMSITETI